MNRKLIVAAAIASGVLLAGCTAHGENKTAAGEFGNVRSVSATVYARGGDYIEFEDETGNLWLADDTGISVPVTLQIADNGTPEIEDDIIVGINGEAY